MMEKLKQVKFDVTLSAVLTVIFGVVVIIYPEQVVTIFAQILAVIFIIVGLVVFIPQLFSVVKNGISMLLGVLVALIGVWMFLRPDAVASIIPIAIGIMMIAHGIQDITLAVEGKENHASNWGVMIFFGFVSIILGCLCIANAFSVITIGMRIIGVMLIYDGLSDMVIVHRVNKAAKVVEGELKKEVNVDEYDDFV